jgi:hypothetical protein
LQGLTDLGALQKSPLAAVSPSSDTFIARRRAKKTPGLALLLKA